MAFKEYDTNPTFLDMEIQRAVSHSRNQQVLSEIDAVINWDPIEKIVQENYPVGQSDFGNKAYPPLMLLKAILIQKWFGIKSDPDLESQINDRFSFKAFMGLPFSEPSPDHSIICRFRERTGKDTLEKVHNELLNQFAMLGLSIKYGMAMDARVVKSVWMPPHGNTELVLPIQSHPKIRKVDPHSTERHDIDIVTRLRNTWLGRIYKRHLKQYAIISWIIRWTWRNGYPLYANFLASFLFTRKVKRWRPLINLKEFAKQRGMPIYKLADEAFVETPEPKVFPTCDQDYMVKPHDHYKFPEIFVATISNGKLYGGTNFILAGSEVVCHDLYDFKCDYTSEELHGRALIDPKSRRIRWLVHDKEAERIPIAAAFVDACAPNYAHWLTEVLPRVTVFCADKQFKSIPIVVNDGLHKNIMESLFLVVGPEREIITLPLNRAVRCDELYITSVAGYVPFEWRSKGFPAHSQGVFSPPAFDLLRKHIYGLIQNTKDQAWPEKIFIRRNSGTRKCINAAELEKLLLDRDYVIVEPEKLTFLQQVQLFNNVKKIIAPTGAALANAIFCKPGTHVVILMAKHERMIYKYWANMLASLQVKIFYVLGNIVKNNNLGIHGDFIVDASVIIDLLEILERK